MAVRVADMRNGGRMPGVLVYAFWRSWKHSDGRDGVIVFNSTGESNRMGGDLRKYEVFFLPGALPYSPLGAATHGGGMLLGTHQ